MSDGIQRVFDRNPRGIAIDASKDAMTRANIELRLEGNEPLDTPFVRTQVTEVQLCDTGWQPIRCGTQHLLHARGIASLTIGLIPNIAIVRLVGENLPDVACTIKVADLLPGNEFAELRCLLLGGETESLAGKVCAVQHDDAQSKLAADELLRLIWRGHQPRIQGPFHVEIDVANLNDPHLVVEALAQLGCTIDSRLLRTAPGIMRPDFVDLGDIERGRKDIIAFVRALAAVAGSDAATAGVFGRCVRCTSSHPCQF